jgi:E3 ubiquitin-protein ligase MYCBP2
VARLPWLQVAVYSIRSQAMVEFKREASRGRGGVPECRFCGTDITDENRSVKEPPSPALENVCRDDECQEKLEHACTKTLPCGHVCGGVRGEETCLPCYEVCVLCVCVRDISLTMSVFQGCDGVTLDKDQMCNMCFTEPVRLAPTIVLDCGHAVHAQCARRKIEIGWNGPRISFDFLQCALKCHVSVIFPTLRRCVMVCAAVHTRALCCADSAGPCQLG